MSMSRESTSLKKSSGDCLKLATSDTAFEWNDAISELLHYLSSAEALVRCGGKL